MPFEVTQDTNRCRITASAPTMSECFVECARGVFSTMYDIERLNSDSSLEIAAQASSKEGLLEAWISELLERAQLHNVAMVEFDVHSIQGLNKDQYLMTGTAHTLPLEKVSSSATDARVRAVKKGSGVIHEGEGHCECELVIETTP